MDFGAVILLLFLYYIRPQEWVPGMGSVHPVAFTLIFALVTMITRPVSPRLKDFFASPHDWFMFAFLAYLVYYSPTPGHAFDDIKNRLVMYIVIVQALSFSRSRQLRFLWWWVGLIFTIALLAVLSEYGFDPTGAFIRTHTIYKDRLILNTSIFNNPNALAHSVVPLVPMLYHLAFWRRPLFVKEVGCALLTVPIYCVYLTKSKGGYLVAAATLILTLAFGRPLIFQAMLWGGGWYGGTALLWSLPRMQQLKHKNLQKDEGIMGRWRAFKWGLNKLNRRKYGIGYGTFAHTMEYETNLLKAAHSSYVEVGAELGKRGLWLWLGVLFCCLRTLVTCKCRTVEEERIRRILFTVVIAYMFSSWVTNISYRGTFFIQAACVAAFHRLLRERDREEEETHNDDQPPPTGTVPERKLEMEAEMPLRPLPEPALALPDGAVEIDHLQHPLPPPPGPRMKPRLSWRRIGILDLFLIYVLLRVIIRVWSRIVYHF